MQTSLGSIGSSGSEIRTQTPDTCQRKLHINWIKVIPPEGHDSVFPNKPTPLEFRYRDAKCSDWEENRAERACEQGHNSTHCVLRDVGSYGVERHINWEEIWKEDEMYKKVIIFMNKFQTLVLWVGLQITLLTPTVPTDITSSGKFFQILLATLVFVLTEVLWDLRWDPKGSHTAGIRDSWEQPCPIHFLQKRTPGPMGQRAQEYHTQACSRSWSTRPVRFLIKTYFSCHWSCLDSIKCKTEPRWQ